MTFSIAEVFLLACVFGLGAALMLSSKRNALHWRMMVALLENLADKKVAVKRSAEGTPQVYPINQGE